MLKKDCFSFWFLMLAFSFPAVAEEAEYQAKLQEIQGEIEKLYEDANVFGLYPAITRAKAIELAKSSGEIQHMEEDVYTQSNSISFRDNSPQRTVSIGFVHHTDQNYINESVRANKIIVTIDKSEAQNEEQYKAMVEKMSSLQAPQTNQMHQYKEFTDACIQNAIVKTTKVKLLSLRKDPSYEDIKLIMTTCPGQWDLYKSYAVNHIQSISRTTFYKRPDNEMLITMTYYPSKLR